MGISMDSLPPRYQKQAARKLDPVAYEKALQFFHAEESAKNPARQAQGSISRATGEGFEAQILTACAYYRAHGIAEIDKTPEPIKVISGRHQNPSGCWSFEAVFTKQAQPDFQGTLCGGSSVVFEAKATDKDRILQSAVTEEQARALESHANMGAPGAAASGRDPVSRRSGVRWAHGNQKLYDESGRIYVHRGNPRRACTPRRHQDHD